MMSVAQQKGLIGQTLKRSSWMRELILKAINDEKRLKILGVLFSHEAEHDQPMAYTKLLKETGLPSNELAYHLKILCQAGLVQQLTPLPLKNATRKTGYRSYYQTTGLAIMVMRAFLTDLSQQP